MRLGEVIKAYKLKNELTVKLLAMAIDIKPSTLSRLENNKKIDLVTFGKIWHWLWI